MDVVFNLPRVGLNIWKSAKNVVYLGIKNSNKLIKHKKKHCKGCDTDQFLFGYQLCKVCYNKKKIAEKKLKATKPRAKIKQVSDKKKVELNIYSKKRAEFLKKYPVCAGAGIIEGCYYDQLLTIHHLCGREGENMLDDKNWMTLCMPCHTFVHNAGSWAYEHGFLKTKHSSEYDSIVDQSE